MARGRRCSRHSERNEQHSLEGDQRTTQHSDNVNSEKDRDIQDNRNVKKRTRGLTYLPHIWVVNPNQPGKEPPRVDFDKFGNPIGPNKSTYVEFLGTIARNGKLAPLNVKDWHGISKSMKDAMVEIVKGKFVLPPGSEVDTLQAIGKSWRSFKNKIKTKHFDPKLSLEGNLRKNPIPPDERVLPGHWKYLLKYWCSESAKGISLKNKKNRENKVMQQITGKKSFAQIKELKKKEKRSDGAPEETEMDSDAISDDEMDEEISRADLFPECYTKDGNTSNPEVAKALERMKVLQSGLKPGAKDQGPEDIFAQVTGHDKGGRVRMYGSRTVAADVFGDIPSRAASYRMNMGYKADMAIMQQQLDDQGKLIRDLVRANKEMARNNNPIVRRVASPSVSRHFAPSPHPQTSSTNCFELQVGFTVYLQSMSDITKLVAKGLILSLDPEKVIGYEALGENWCEVKVNVAMEFEEPLLRSVENAKIVGDAIGCSIAWPKDLVAMDKVW